MEYNKDHDATGRDRFDGINTQKSQPTIPKDHRPNRVEN